MLDKPTVDSPAEDGSARRADVDRRTFLKLAGTGALAGTSVLAAGARPGAAGAQPRPIDAPALSRQTPDIVVVGAGAFGCWTAFHLQRLGAKVLLMDAYGPGNARATSGDETRGIRTAYGDRELWTRWASKAIVRWRAWSEEFSRDYGAPLYFDTGDIILRSDWDPFLTQTRTVWETLGIPFETLTPDEVHYRYPGVFDLADIGVALFEPNAGVGRARRSCEVVAAAFRREGGPIEIARAQPGLQVGRTLTEIALSSGTRRSAGIYVFACGPWLGKVFPDVMGRRIRTPLGYVVYYSPPIGDHRFTYPNMPSFNFPGVTGWPGLPVDNRGFRVRTGGGGVTDPDASDRWIPADALERPREFLASRFPALKDAPISQTHACHYELSPNRNFLIDRHPEMQNVWLVGTGNAEGFKFSPLIGEYAAHRLLGRELEPELVDEFRLSEQEYPEGDEPDSPSR